MSKLDELLETLENQMALLKTEVAEFQGGKKVAATRARVAALGMIKNLKEVRVEIQNNR